MSEPRFSLSGYPDLTGCLADVADWFMQTAIRPRREAAYVVALSFGSVVCGRFYEFERSFSSNYVCVIAETGSGKQGRGNRVGEAEPEKQSRGSPGGAKARPGKLPGPGTVGSGSPAETADGQLRSGHFR